MTFLYFNRSYRIIEKKYPQETGSNSVSYFSRSLESLLAASISAGAKWSFTPGIFIVVPAVWRAMLILFENRFSLPALFVYMPSSSY